jgi:predicted HicB family RNase H-like nuclease
MTEESTQKETPSKKPAEATPKVSPKKAPKKLSPKMRVWVKREVHAKVREFAKSNKKSLLETYETLINNGLTFEALKPKA